MIALRLPSQRPSSSRRKTALGGYVNHLDSPVIAATTGMLLGKGPSRVVLNAHEARSRRSGETALQVMDDTQLMLTIARLVPVEWSGAQIQKAEALAPGDDRGHTPGVPEPNLALQT